MNVVMESHDAFYKECHRRCEWLALCCPRSYTDRDMRDARRLNLMGGEMSNDSLFIQYNSKGNVQ